MPETIVTTKHSQKLMYVAYRMALINNDLKCPFRELGSVIAQFVKWAMAMPSS